MKRRNMKLICLSPVIITAVIGTTVGSINGATSLSGPVKWEPSTMKNVRTPINDALKPSGETRRFKGLDFGFKYKISSAGIASFWYDTAAFNRMVVFHENDNDIGLGYGIIYTPDDIEKAEEALYSQAIDLHFNLEILGASVTVQAHGSNTFWDDYKPYTFSSDGFNWGGNMSFYTNDLLGASGFNDLNFYYHTISVDYNWDNVGIVFSMEENETVARLVIRDYNVWWLKFTLRQDAPSDEVIYSWNPVVYCPTSTENSVTRIAAYADNSEVNVDLSSFGGGNNQGYTLGITPVKPGAMTFDFDSETIAEVLKKKIVKYNRVYNLSEWKEVEEEYDYDFNIKASASGWNFSTIGHKGNDNLGFGNEIVNQTIDSNQFWSMVTIVPNTWTKIPCCSKICLDWDNIGLGFRYVDGKNIPYIAYAPHANKPIPVLHWDVVSGYGPEEQPPYYYWQYNAFELLDVI